MRLSIIPTKLKVPTALYGLNLRVRKPVEEGVAPTAVSLGLEVFRDENIGALIYISETGSLAVVPAPARLRSGEGVDWVCGMELKARAGGEVSFDRAPGYGIDAFGDLNTGYLVYASHVGSIAVLAVR